MDRRRNPQTEAIHHEPSGAFVGLLCALMMAMCFVPFWSIW